MSIRETAIGKKEKTVLLPRGIRDDKNVKLIADFDKAQTSYYFLVWIEEKKKKLQNLSV